MRPTTTCYGADAASLPCSNNVWRCEALVRNFPWHVPSHLRFAATAESPVQSNCTIRAFSSLCACGNTSRPTPSLHNEPEVSQRKILTQCPPHIHPSRLRFAATAESPVQSNCTIRSFSSLHACGNTSRPKPSLHNEPEVSQRKILTQCSPPHSS